MNKIILILALLAYTKSFATDRIAVSFKQRSILTFASPVQHVNIDSKNYLIESQMGHVHIQAKSAATPPATLSVTTENDYYVCQVFPDENARIHIRIGEKQMEEEPKTSPRVQAKSKKNHKHILAPLFSDSERQQYSWFGTREDGILIMVTNITHSGPNTHLRVYVENQTSIDLKLSKISFDYVTVLRKWLFVPVRQLKEEKPVLGPKVITIAPAEFDYFEFAVPTRVAGGGLDVILSESDKSSRRYKINLPSRVLLKANRQENQ